MYKVAIRCFKMIVMGTISYKLFTLSKKYDKVKVKSNKGGYICTKMTLKEESKSAKVSIS